MASDVERLRQIVDQRLRDKAQRVNDDDLATLVKKGVRTEADLAAAPAYVLSSALGGLLGSFTIHTLLEEFNHGELVVFHQLQSPGSCFAPSNLTPISSADDNSGKPVLQEGWGICPVSSKTTCTAMHDENLPASGKVPAWLLVTLVDG